MYSNNTVIITTLDPNLRETSLSFTQYKLYKTTLFGRKIINLHVLTALLIDTIRNLNINNKNQLYLRIKKQLNSLCVLRTSGLTVF